MIQKMFKLKEIIQIYHTHTFALTRITNEYPYISCDLQNLKEFTFDSLISDNPPKIYLSSDFVHEGINTILEKSINLKAFTWNVHFHQMMGFWKSDKEADLIRFRDLLLIPLKIERLTVGKITMIYIKKFAEPLIKKFTGEYLKINYALETPVKRTGNGKRRVIVKKSTKYIKTYSQCINVFLKRCDDLLIELNALDKHLKYQNNISKLILSYAKTSSLPTLVLCSRRDGQRDFQYYGQIAAKITKNKKRKFKKYQRLMQSYKFNIVIERKKMFDFVNL